MDTHPTLVEETIVVILGDPIKILQIALSFSVFFKDQLYIVEKFMQISIKKRP